MTLKLLSQHPIFGKLPPSSRQELAEHLHPHDFAAGDMVLREGDEGDTFFLIESGQAEVWKTGPRGDILLGSLGPFDDFGEIAVISGDNRRSASVKAATDLRVYSLTGKALQSAMAQDPALHDHFQEIVEQRLLLRFLRAAAPFAGLGPEQLQALADKLERRSVPSGQDIIRQGDIGNSCFLLRHGEAEVIHQGTGGALRTLTTLEAGAVFGEVALLTEEPRNATIRALGPCELLCIKRDDFIEATRDNAELGLAMFELVQLRGRPRRAPHVTAHPRITVMGDEIAVLRDEIRHQYFQLSPQGWFLWQQLDGDATFKDLTLAHFRRYKQFAPDKVLRLISSLGQAGYVEGSVVTNAMVDEQPRTGLDHLLAMVQHILQWRLTLRNVDAVFDRLYRAGGWVFFTLTANIVIMTLFAVGLVAAVGSLEEVIDAFHRTNPMVLLWMIPANMIALFFHECGHAMAVKHADRRINGAGVGWYWLKPVAFVDTTDMWLAGRRSRLIVGFAGIYVNLLIASLAAIVAWLGEGFTALMALQVAAVNYAAVVVNLNPLLEYDGYHLLEDWFDRPGLRKRSFETVARYISDKTDGRRSFVLEFAYVAAAVAYVATLVIMILWLFRQFFETQLMSVMSHAEATALAWGVSLLIGLLATLGIWNDLRSAARAG